MTAVPSANTVHHPAVEATRRRVSGDVLAPGDPGYAEHATGFNLVFAHRPDVLVVPRDAADVAAALRVADEFDLPVGVQATGHGVGAVSDGGMLLVTSAMTDVEVDAEARTARVAAGAKWAHVLAAATPHGLAPLLGSTSDVGAVAYTLGGGYGWLGRRFGLAADHVRSFEVALASGDLVDVSPTERPELFWALRGGGAGAFGVVTEMTIDLVAITQIYGGNLVYPASMAGPVMRRWREWIDDVPDELTSSVLVMNYPPFPEIPEPLRGGSFVMVRGAWSGDAEDGERLLDHWRAWRPPLLDDWRWRPVSEIDDVSQDPVDPLHGATTSEWLHDLPDGAVDAIVRHVLPSDGPPALVFCEIRHVGGAVSAAPPETAGAYGNRDAHLVLEAVGILPTPDDHDVIRGALDDLRALLAPYTTGGTYLNFLEGEERRVRTREGFSDAAWARLRDVKAKYDPHDRFRRGLAIPPAV